VLGITILSPGTPSSIPWMACECCAPEPQPRPIAAQTTIGTFVLPLSMKWNLAAWVTS
jgi:hypothetical protein